MIWNSNGTTSGWAGRYTAQGTTGAYEPMFCGTTNESVMMVNRQYRGAQRTIVSGTLTVLLAWAIPAAALGQEPSPLELFQQRIMPIFNSPEPSSCVQCHLSSVDLKDYILPSSRETFLSLRDQGLIDMDHPERSKILHLIAMGERDPDPVARRIHEKTRRAEYEAFAAWIKACSSDPELRTAPPLNATHRAGPKVEEAVIRHTRKDQLLDGFVRNVWSQRMRCFPCHTPFEIDPENPAHQLPARRHAELEETYGQRINIFQQTPEETLRRLIINSRKRREDRLQLLNTDAPLESLLLLKPMSRVPGKDAAGNPRPASNVPPVTHGGGIKMHENDPSYKAFASWLQDYARTVKGQYKSADQLPPASWIATEYVLRIMPVPQQWKAGTVVQVFVVPAPDDEQPADRSQPVAFTQSVVTPRGALNGTLFLILDQRQAESVATEMPPGRYRLEVYLDRHQKLAEDPALLLRDSQLPDAQAVIEAQWREGFKNAVVVPGKMFRFVER